MLNKINKRKIKINNKIHLFLIMFEKIRRKLRFRIFYFCICKFYYKRAWKRRRLRVIQYGHSSYYVECQKRLGSYRTKGGFYLLFDTMWNIKQRYKGFVLLQTMGKKNKADCRYYQYFFTSRKFDHNLNHIYSKKKFYIKRKLKKETRKCILMWPYHYNNAI